MNIIYLNIFEGCKEKSRLNRIIEFARTEKPDVLGLSELYNWQKQGRKKLNYFLKKTGFKYHIFASSGFNRNVGLFSSLPIKKQKIFRRGFRSPVIKAEIEYKGQTVSVFLAHLRAKNE